jgi:hypothetical protein
VRSIRIIGVVAVLAAALAGCSTSAPNAGPTRGAATTPAATKAAPATSAAGGGTAVTTADPCQLVTAAEASQLTGASFGPGKREDVPGGVRQCVYGYQTTNVFLVAVVTAASVAEAQAAKAQILAEAQSKLGGTALSLKKVPGLGDDAQEIHSSMSANGVTINLAGLYVLTGATGFALVDVVVGAAAPSIPSLVTQAQTLMTRLP